MSIKSRIKKLEDANGIAKVNVADELERLKALALSGNAPPEKTVADYEVLISECDNPDLCHLYKQVIRAIT